MANVLFIEPFYGGSHKYFADGIKRYSEHKITLLTLPGRFWKWRMEGGAMELARLAEGLSRPDLIVLGNLIDLSLWKNLCPWPGCPHILYVHENQLDYPLSPGEKRDFHYVWKDYCNFRLADRIIFNSAYNRDSFTRAFPSFASRLPDCRPSLDELSMDSKATVIPPGCTLIPGEAALRERVEKSGEAPVLLWNHRWEHDKNPEPFFNLLKSLKDRHFPFRLILLGESYKDAPACFSEAEGLFKEELIHYGYAPSRSEYESLLSRSDIVFSTSLQENFGIAVVEAMSAGALPLLPERLAYPEVLPPFLHELCLYQRDGEMEEKLKGILGRSDLKELRGKMRNAVKPYGWESMIRRFDEYLNGIHSGSENLKNSRGVS